MSSTIHFRIRWYKTTRRLTSSTRDAIPSPATAPERRIGLRGAPVSGEGPGPERRIDAGPRPVHEVLDRRRDDDRQDENENEIERRLPLAAQPQRNREEGEDVRAAERRDEDHNEVHGRVRAGEVERPEEELVHPADGGEHRNRVHAAESGDPA